MVKNSWVNLALRLGVSISYLILFGLLLANIKDIMTIDWHKLIFPIVVNLVLYGLALGLQGIVWLRLFQSITSVMLASKDVINYYKTHLMRRIPGAPWYIAGRALAYHKPDTNTARAAVTASLFEWAGMFLSGLGWIGWSLYHWSGLLVFIVVVCGGIHIIRCWKQVSSRIRLDRFSLSDLYFALLAYEGQWLLASLIMYIFLSALSLNSSINFIETSKIWAISGVVSSLAFFAPMGLGIREFSIIAMLDSHIGTSFATLIAILMRVLFIIGDVLWSSLIIGFAPRHNSST